MMMELSGVSRSFGGVRAVDGLDLEIGQGQVFGLIGPNGSGKSTTLNLISGLLEPTAGRIVLDGKDISRAPLHSRIGCGMSRTFQHSRLFGQLTVWENLLAAQDARGSAGRGWWGRWFGRARGYGEAVEQALHSSGLAHRRDALASDLSYGEQRRLELARALATRPRLLLLDEPAAGMDAGEIGHLRLQIAGLRRAGVAVLLVEHVMDLVMAVADRIAVLDFGRKIAEGTPPEIRNDPAVRRAYLGGVSG
jgi:branched-chain amino acid transport system ATP-binding protein